MPGYRGKRFLPVHIKRDIHRVMGQFPNSQIRVKRLKEVYETSGEQTTDDVLIYEGEALVRAASGDAEGYGLGTVENQSLVVVINGVFPIQQGDLITINDSREYEVDFPPTHFNAVTVMNVAQRSQITQLRQGQ